MIIVLAAIGTGPLCGYAQAVIPDTLDWRGYYPLQVGNEWHYTETAFITPIPSYYRFQITSDSLVGNSRYYIQKQEFFDAGFQLTHEARVYLRYDSVGTVVGFGSTDDDTSSTYKAWWVDLPLKSNFGDTLGHVGDSTRVVGRYNDVIGVSGVPYDVPAVKAFGPHPGPWGVYSTYAYGVGMTDKEVFDGPTTRLGYAVIGGRVLGSPVVTIGREEVPEAMRNGRPAITVTYPNPASSTTTLALYIPMTTTVQVEAYDVLGKRILTTTAHLPGPSRHTLTLDVSTLRAGIYFVRLKSEGRVEARSLVVAR